jgi:hypothetical protein
MTSLKLVAATTPNSRTPLHPVQPAQGKSEAYKWLFIAGKRGGSNKGCVASLGMNRTARQKSGKTRLVGVSSESYTPRLSIIIVLNGGT